MLKVKLTYFKPSGKYYSEGEFEVKETFHMYQIIEMVQGMVDQKKLPGLSKGAFRYIVLVEAPDHPEGYPALVNTEIARKIR